MRTRNFLSARERGPLNASSGGSWLDGGQCAAAGSVCHYRRAVRSFGMEGNVSYGEWLRLCASDDAEHVGLLLEGLESNDGSSLDPGLVLDAWSHPEWPEAVFGTTRWVALFRSVGFASRPPRPEPTDGLQVFRGASWERRRGMAWTTDRAVAQRFADRWTASGAGAGRVFARWAPVPAILAMIDDRNEAEVVVDPDLLLPIRPMATGP